VKTTPGLYDKRNLSPKEEVRGMFDRIAPKYDFLNHFLSFGVDRAWRKRLIRELKKYHPENVLDLATGTADLAIMAAKAEIPFIVGIDISEQMLQIGNEKIRNTRRESQVKLYLADAESIPFADEHFDAAMVAFGIRNFENLDAGLKEILRVLNHGAPVLLLEFSKPEIFPVKQLYHFYSRYLLPLIGSMVSRDFKAYRYLPESIRRFPSGNDFLAVFSDAGFIHCRQKRLSFGIATLYTGIKPGIQEQ